MMLLSFIIMLQFLLYLENFIYLLFSLFKFNFECFIISIKFNLDFSLLLLRSI